MNLFDFETITVLSEAMKIRIFNWIISHIHPLKYLQECDFNYPLFLAFINLLGIFCLTIFLLKKILEKNVNKTLHLVNY